MFYTVKDVIRHGKANTYIAHGNDEAADCVLGFSFGYIDGESGPLPGKSNEQLARFIERRFPTTPLILQFEIVDALKIRTPDMIIRESRNKGEYLNSYEIALQALDFMKQKGWNKIAVVTHPAMEARNDAMCAKLGMTTIAPTGLEAIEYDPDSAQSWTRNPKSWWQREEKIIEIGAQNNWI